MFFTPSLLLALQFAHFRKGAYFHGVPEQNIRITCFDTEQARTPHGNLAQFACMQAMTKNHGIEFLDDGEPRKFSAEYVTMDCVVLDSTARTASFEEILEQGLYRLYPAIQEATNNTRFAPRVNVELKKLRKFCYPKFGTIRPCDYARIDLAAKLAATFKASIRSEERVSGHLLAWMLSLTKRDASGYKAISQWLGENTYARPSDSVEHDTGDTMDTSTMPEVSQFLEILPLMSNITIGNQVLSATTSISAKENQQEIFDWRDQQQLDNAEHQERRKAKQAATAAVAKEKRAVKKAKATKQKAAEAAKKSKVQERAQKKKATEKEAKEKRKAKMAKDRIAAEKVKEKLAKEKAKLILEKIKVAKAKAKIAMEKCKAAEKANAATTKKGGLSQQGWPKFR